MAQAQKVVLSGAGTVKVAELNAANMIVAIYGVAGAAAIDAEVWITAADGTITSAGAYQIAHVKGAAAANTQPLSFSSDGVNIAQGSQAAAGAPNLVPCVAVKFNDADAAHEVWIYYK